MKKNLNGLILREADYGEKDKIINVLTGSNGIISAIVKGAKSAGNKKSSMVQCFAYGDFLLYARKNGYALYDFEIKELFWGIREDLYNLSLAQYFSQLCFAFSPDESSSSELLRLLLNVLFYISNGKKSLEVLKAIFELRGCSICGYMPNLTGCVHCKKYESSKMYFSPENGVLICGDCLKKTLESQRFTADFLSEASLAALRHIVYSDFNKLFSFSVSKPIEKELEYISEKYVRCHLGSNFRALDFYKSLFSN